MARKTKLLSPENLVIAAKSFVSGFVSSLFIIPIMILAFWIINTKNMMAFGRGLQLLGMVAGWQLYGYFSNKFWGWK